MIKDPKQIVTPFAFEVHPDLLGLPLATPSRRFAALLLDLLIASILTALGAFFLATTSSILFFWLAIRNKGTIWWKNLFRYGVATFISILVFALTMYVTDTEDNDSISNLATVELNNGSSGIDGANDIDWGSFADEISSMSQNDSVDIEDQLEQVFENLEMAFDTSSDSTLQYPNELFESSFIAHINELSTAITNNDTLAIDTLRSHITPILAMAELNAKNDRIISLRGKIENLEEDNEALTEQVENPSFLRSLKATAEDFGLSVGWIGVYFVLCLALFKGQTLGKRILKLRVVRLNNKPIGLLYSFERFGGYAAGFATGLLGFAQVYWDSNRQGIHDKIASTVVIDMREKIVEKYDDLRKEIISEENLLD